MAKAPTYSEPTERGVLGSLLVSPTAFWAMKDRVRQEVFTVPVHRTIVKILHELADSNRQITSSAVISRIPVEDDSDFEPAGYVATLIADEADGSALEDDLGDLEEMHVRRQMIAYGQSLIQEATVDSGVDAGSRLEKAREKIDALGDRLGSNVEHVASVASRVLGGVEEAWNSEETVGLDVGLKALQDLIGPLMPARLYTFAGPPGSGKTALAWGVARFVAQKWQVKFDEIEMPPEEMVERDLAARAGIPPDKIERAAINQDEMMELYAKAGELNALKLYIDGSTAPTIYDVRAKAMKQKRTRGLDLLVVDHLLLMAKPDRKMDQFEAIRENLRGLKRIAKDLNIPVIVLTQLKSEYDRLTWKQIRAPQEQDCFGGGTVKQESDVLLFVYRAEALLQNKKPEKTDPDFPEWEARLAEVEGTAEFILNKRRGGKGHGRRRAYFHGPTTSFLDSPPRTTRAQEDLAL